MLHAFSRFGQIALEWEVPLVDRLAHVSLLKRSKFGTIFCVEDFYFAVGGGGEDDGTVSDVDVLDRAD